MYNTAQKKGKGKWPNVIQHLVVHMDSASIEILEVKSRQYQDIYMNIITENV